MILQTVERLDEDLDRPAERGLELGLAVNMHAGARKQCAAFLRRFSPLPAEVTLNGFGELTVWCRGTPTDDEYLHVCFDGRSHVLCTVRGVGEVSESVFRISPNGCATFVACLQAKASR